MKLRTLLIIASMSLMGAAGITTAGMNQQRSAGSNARLRVVQLSTDEIANILYMRQEEKLARDVYLTFLEQYGATVFANISNSEQRHMDAIKRLIDLYQLEDSASDDTIGIFSDPEFTKLYEDLTDLGANSLLDAYSVGVVIEETDIADLTEKLEQTEMINIQRVFSNLLAGSERHLAAFNQNIDYYDTNSQGTCPNNGTCVNGGTCTNDGTGTQARDRDGTCINK